MQIQIFNDYHHGGLVGCTYHWLVALFVTCNCLVGWLYHDLFANHNTQLSPLKDRCQASLPIFLDVFVAQPQALPTGLLLGFEDWDVI